MRSIFLCALLICSCMLGKFRTRAGHPIALTPALGWNSWYALGKKPGWEITNQSTMYQTAVAMHRLGLVETGYNILVIDDSWSASSRSSDAPGLRANLQKFPDMKTLSQNIAALNITLGLYTTPGKYTCAGEHAAFGGSLGSLGHYQDDVRFWAKEWNVGYIKNCVCNTTPAMRQHAYGDMAAAIDENPISAANQVTPAKERQIVYECCNFMDSPWGNRQAKQHQCNIWSVCDDVDDNFTAWTSVVDIAYDMNINQNVGPQANGNGRYNFRGGGWSSFDYLQVGGKQTLPEYRAQMSMFAILAAPIFIGTDLRSITPEQLAVYQAPGVLAVHQDVLGQPGDRLLQNRSSEVEVWFRPLANTTTCAIFLLNRAAGLRTIAFNYSDIVHKCTGGTAAGQDVMDTPGRQQYKIVRTWKMEDVWQQQFLQGSFQDNFTALVDSHSSLLYVAHARTSITVVPAKLL